ncbi:Tyrosine-phosphatase 1 [Hyphodiscus hymeniophilus]|uniref:protein-tyrosine-phosphatase n=1 Tax=Hyphodiscus hymeniophilus TaxID=353542 RepID=A0A9P6VHG2_9HELO|nr:Tyrosine-phosphatase 1 [Hyphodiscus hymeniophilus]
MVTKTATRPTPRSSHSHSHPQSHRTPSRPSTTPHSPPARIPPSVGQALPPPIPNTLLRSPGTQTDVRTPSPNYFGLIVDPASDPRDSAVGPKDNWSPPTSSIRSFGANSPKRLPLDANPDFEAFRRQTESSNSFNLGHGNLSHFASTPGVVPPRPRPDRRPTRTDTQEQSPKSGPRARDGTPDKMELDGGRETASASKRGSDATMNAPSFFDIPRQESPAGMTMSPARMTMSPVQRNVLSHLDDRHPRLSLPQNKADPPSPHFKAQKSREDRGSQNQRADTLPVALEDGPVFISPKQLTDINEHIPSSQFLLLDLRVFPQFSASRIQGALNLCIPTTLLKRPSFNIQKLQETFTNEVEKERFSQWKNAKFIIVYDAFSSDKKDATSSINTLKKFTTEGWKGHRYILRGGFQEFSKQFSSLVDSRSSQEMQSSTKINLSWDTKMPMVAPVAGGCAMPATKNAANPFFSNIRQNQDLIGGVGQMDVKIPDELQDKAETILPTWLAEAADKADHGKKVSDKFLHLELAEQSRMTKALSSNVSYGTPHSENRDVQIAGIEKGGKNRYNNIWPFEHARVRLQGRPEGACDYVNASHIKSSRSNKRYIASQGPLPATFEDFWSVIWDQDVRVIVMLTAEKEGGQLKCHPYWSSKDYGPLKLKNLSEKKISLDLAFKKHQSPPERNDAGRRRANTVADNASPVSAAASATSEPPHAIVRKSTTPPGQISEHQQVRISFLPSSSSAINCNVSPRPSHNPPLPEPENDAAARPILVHCSAGCGRTGTFCTIDTVIDMLKRQRKEIKSGVTPMEFDVDVPASVSDSGDYMAKGRPVADDWIFNADLDLVQKTVEDFRCQRLSMVQSLRQYVLCYETVLEWIAQQNFGGIRPVGGRERSGSDGLIERV